MISRATFLRGPRWSVLTGLTLSSGDLSQSRLHLGIQRVLGHDEDDTGIMSGVRLQPSWSRRRASECTYGRCSSIKARGPCFNSPARIYEVKQDIRVSSRRAEPTQTLVLTPSECMYETSLIFRAPSKQVATGQRR
jgi:hypothetical protein